MNGWVSEAPDGRHSSVWFWPILGDAALVELLAAGVVEVLFAVAVGSEPEPLLDEPLLRSLRDVPVPELAAARPPADDAARALVVVDAPDKVDAPSEEDVVVVGPEAVAPLVELVETPSIVAPRPAVPADAPPPDEPPPPPVLGAEVAVTVGVLVSVTPVVDEFVPVLVKV
ncbi:MAG: hypothetical protein WAV02_21720 [Stellaceae bacterium]